MKRKHYPWLLGAVALTAGCAQAPLEKAAEPAIKVAPVYRVQQPAGTAAGQYAVGRIDLAEGRVGAAIKRFQQALQLDSGFVEAHNGLGVAYGQQGRYAEAAAAFRAALALSPESPHVLNNLGFAQLKAGQLEDATASLNRSLALDSGNERTRENIALLAAARTAVASALASAAAPASPVADRGSAAPPAAAVPAVPSAPATAAAAAAAPAVAAPVVAATPVTTAPTAPAPAVAAPAIPVPRPALTIQPVAVPQVVSRPAFEVVVSRSNESALVQVAPNVYELRQGEAIATSSPAPAVASAQPSPIGVVASGAPTAAPATPEVQAPVAAPPVAATPVAATPVAATPVAATPVAATPVAATPVAATPVAATPVAATPVAEPVAAATQPSTPEALAVAAVAAQPLAKAPQPDVKPSQVKAAESEPSKAQQAQVIQPPPVTQFSLAARPLSPAKRPATTASLGGLDGLEVSNGVGIRHLAGRTARSLSQLGVTVARVSDYRLFGRQRTEIHYRSGHVDQAMAVRTSLPVGARLVRTDRLHPSVNVRLVIGKDLVERQVAWLGEDVLTADAEDATGVIRPPMAAGKGLDLAAHAGKVARADVENGWRYL